jgi:hypothetical protein
MKKPVMYSIAINYKVINDSLTFLLSMISSFLFSYAEKKVNIRSTKKEALIMRSSMKFHSTKSF